MKTQSIALTLLVASAPAALAGCTQDAAMPTEAVGPGTAAVKPDAPGAGSDRMFFQAKLAPQGESRARGMLLLEIDDGQLSVRLHANGVEPGEHIPQHIHVNPGCNPGGAILINLDASLTVAGEAPGTGAAYPVASHAGIVKYEASRPLTEILAAVNQYSGANLADVDALIAWLDLENRNAHMHVAFGPPFPAVNCGEVERLN